MNIAIVYDFSELSQQTWQGDHLWHKQFSSRLRQQWIWKSSQGPWFGGEYLILITNQIFVLCGFAEMIKFKTLTSREVSIRLSVASSPGFVYSSLSSDYWNGGLSRGMNCALFSDDTTAASSLDWDWLPSPHKLPSWDLSLCGKITFLSPNRVKYSRLQRTKCRHDKCSCFSLICESRIFWYFSILKNLDWKHIQKA